MIDIKSIKKVLILNILLGATLVMGQTTAPSGPKVFPRPLILLDPFFTHHVLIAEKSTHRLFLYRNEQGIPELVKIYQMATGKMAGNKIFQGDYRTPEGIYNFREFLPHEELIRRHGKEGEIYGVGAFVMNYPNSVDFFNGKTGGGIWLHSTNDETRIDKGLDSRGCIVASNDDLKEISKYIELNRTSVIVVQDLNLVSDVTWKENQKVLKETIENWLNSWANENIDAYLSYYHEKDFRDPYKKNYNGWKVHKKAVFLIPGSPRININNLSILDSGNYAVARFKQEYSSGSLTDIGIKTLYLKKNEYYQWKIIAENWTKTGLETEGEQVASFVPSMRFFKQHSSDMAPLKKENN